MRCNTSTKYVYGSISCNKQVISNYGRCPYTAPRFWSNRTSSSSGAPRQVESDVQGDWYPAAPQDPPRTLSVTLRTPMHTVAFLQHRTDRRFVARPQPPDPGLTPGPCQNHDECEPNRQRGTGLCVVCIDNCPPLGLFPWLKCVPKY